MSLKVLWLWLLVTLVISFNGYGLCLLHLVCNVFPRSFTFPIFCIPLVYLTSTMCSSLQYPFRGSSEPVSSPINTDVLFELWDSVAKDNVQSIPTGTQISDEHYSNVPGNLVHGSGRPPVKISSHGFQRDSDDIMTQPMSTESLDPPDSQTHSSQPSKCFFRVAVRFSPNVRGLLDWEIRKFLIKREISLLNIFL